MPSNPTPTPKSIPLQASPAALVGPAAPALLLVLVGCVATVAKVPAAGGAAVILAPIDMELLLIVVDDDVVDVSVATSPEIVSWPGPESSCLFT